jgi:TPR repeat protein
MKKYLIYLLTMLFIAIILPVQAALSEHETEVLISEARTNQNAVNTIKLAAEQGDKVAQTGLGLLYNNGEGVPLSYSQAIIWYSKAAGQNYAVAQYNLGMIYEGGYGVPQDYVQAFNWLSKASEQGLAIAQHTLGLMYESGHGVTQSYTEAVKWLRKSAEQGHNIAIFELGNLFETGKGVSQSYVAAYGLYNLITDDNQLQIAANQLEYIRTKMNRQEIDAGQALTKELQKQSGNFLALNVFLNKNKTRCIE